MTRPGSTPSPTAIEQAIPGVDARTMSEFQAGAGQVLGTLDMLLLLIISLALIVGSVGILNTMLMSTTERFAEFGILRTNGWSRGDVLHLVLAESVSLGVLAGVVGCLLALGGVTIVNRYLEHGLQLALTPRPARLGPWPGGGAGQPGRSLSGLARLAPGPDGDHPPGLEVSWARRACDPIITSTATWQRNRKATAHSERSRR